VHSPSPTGDGVAGLPHTRYGTQPAGAGAEEGLADGLGIGDHVGIAFEGDEGARRAEGEKPVLVERKLFALAPELVEVR